MYKLLFAICISVLVTVVAWMGLMPLDSAVLSLKLEKDKVYKVWIDADRKLDTGTETEEFPGDWEELRKYTFILNPNPEDTLRPGRIRSLGMGGSGGHNFFRPLMGADIDTTDTLAVKQHYLGDLPLLAAENLSSMLFPFYPQSGTNALARAAYVISDPFDHPDSLKRKNRYMPKKFRMMRAEWMGRRGANYLDEVVSRIEKLYPGKPVSAGMSWRVKTETVTGVRVNEITDVTVRDKKAGRVSLEVSSKAGTGDTPLHMDSSGVFMTIVFNATQNGNLEVVESTGMIESGLFEQRVEGMFRVDSVNGLNVSIQAPFVITGRFRLALEEALNAKVPPRLRGDPKANDQVSHISSM